MSRADGAFTSSQSPVIGDATGSMAAGPDDDEADTTSALAATRFRELLVRHSTNAAGDTAAAAALPAAGDATGTLAAGASEGEEIDTGCASLGSAVWTMHPRDALCHSRRQSMAREQ